MEEQSIKAIIEIIKQVGFPVLVACWFMYRTDKRLDKLTAAINNLRVHKYDEGDEE